MKTILDIITPIKLLSGSHPDTKTTGQGCAMNVIAYLNGEDQITDQSPCVCVTVRKPLIWLNDYLKDDERQELVPYLLRAMGSATDDKTVINARLVNVAQFANAMADIAKRTATNAATYAATTATHAATNAATHAATTATYATHAATTATHAATNAATRAATNATHAAIHAATNAAATKKEIKAAGFAFLDAVLPKLIEPSQEIINRAHALAELAA